MRERGWADDSTNRDWYLRETPTCSSAFCARRCCCFAQEGPDLMTMPKSDYHDLLRSTKDLRPVPSAVYAARATAGSPPVSSEGERAGSPGGATDVRCSVPSHVTFVSPLYSVMSPIASVCTWYSLVAAVCRNLVSSTYIGFCCWLCECPSCVFVE
jgi:hypothetical protein